MVFPNYVIVHENECDLTQ